MLTPAADDCLTEQTLLDCLEGRLSVDERVRIDAHFAVCRECFGTLAAQIKAASADEPPQPASETAPDLGAHDEHGGPAHLRPVSEGSIKLGRYVIRRAIGAGAMGVVYSAYDPALHRRVALKLLRTTGSADTGPKELRERLLREARALARLNHPAVISVYDVGTAGEQVFVAMELVEGGTLRDWLGQGDRPWRDVLDVLLPAARGLAAAHAAGIVHRDFKPDNVLVGRDGRVRVTDFGLARLTEPTSMPDTARWETPAYGSPRAPSEPLSLASVGGLVGSPAYMAPEQMRRTPPDRRADVFGFCVTLYEALYGERPFRGRNLAELEQSIARNDIRRVPRVKRVPYRLRRLLLRGLRADPAERFQTMDELIVALERTLRGNRMRRVAPIAAMALLAAGAAVWGHKPAVRRGHATVVVADVVNLSGDDALSGLSGMLITSLEQSRFLRVVTRSRMFDLLRELGKERATRLDDALARQVAKSAKADALLLGRIHRFGDVYSLEMEAVEPRTDEVLFTTRVDAAGKSGIPRAIDALALQVRASLDEPVGQVAPLHVAERTTASLEAYQHYFRGQQLVDGIKLAGAIDEFKAAIRLDPQFALAHYWLAYALHWYGHYSGIRDELKLASRDLDAVPAKERYLIRSLTASLAGDQQEALEQYQRCLERFPAEKEAAFGAGDIAFHTGDYATAEKYLVRSLELAPSMERGYQHLIWTYQRTGRFSKMIEAAERYVARVGGDQAQAHLGRAYAAAGDLAQARAVFQRSQRLFPQSPLPLQDLGALDEWEGDFVAAEAQLQRLLEPSRPLADRRQGRLMLAGLRSLEGRYREMMRTLDELLRAGVEAHDGETVYSASLVKAMAWIIAFRDPAQAKQAVRAARTLGVPEEAFHFVYPYVDDFQTFDRVAKAVGPPLADLTRRAYQHRAQGDLVAAVAELQELAARSPDRGLLLFDLGSTLLQANQPQRAVEAFRKMLTTFPDVPYAGMSLGAGNYPRAWIALGKAYERLGESDPAIESYQRVLRMWRRADPDLPELMEVKASVLRLRARAMLGPPQSAAP